MKTLISIVSCWGCGKTSEEYSGAGTKILPRQCTLDPAETTPLAKVWETILLLTHPRDGGEGCEEMM